MAERIWMFLFGWWYSEDRRGWHPDGFGGEQPLWCALVSLVLGPKMDGGSFPTEFGTDHWWECRRCHVHDSSL